MQLAKWGARGSEGREWNRTENWICNYQYIANQCNLKEWAPVPPPVLPENDSNIAAPSENNKSRRLSASGGRLCSTPSTQATKCIDLKILWLSTMFAIFKWKSQRYVSQYRRSSTASICFWMCRNFAWNWGLHIWWRISSRPFWVISAGNLTSRRLYSHRG